MPRPTNLLLITSDQQHRSTLGVTNPRIRTPALDRLCREGTRFTRAYCPNPTCTPTRASMITGLYPSVHGAWTLGTKLPEDVPTLGDWLRAAGYRSGLFGKAHFQPLASTPAQTSLECQPRLRDIDFWRGFHGPWYGFDQLEICRNHADETHAGQHYGAWMEDRGLTNWRDHFQAWPPDRDAPRRRWSWSLPEEYHYTRFTAERTIAWLEQQAAAEQPFFAWASFHDPHPPYLVSEPWASMYRPDEMEPGTLLPGEHEANPRLLRLTQEQRPDFSPWREEHGNHGLHSHRHDEAALRRDIAVYYGMISFMDQQIGTILEAVDRLGLADDTLVVFTTDHGHYYGHHGLIAKGPFHYEDGICLPFIVRWPGRVPGGGVSDSLQSLLDLPQTFVAAAGVPEPRGLQGVNQLDCWCGGAPARDHVLCEFHHQPTRLNLRTFIDQHYKLTVYHDSDEGELRDLVADPDERVNLWADPAAAELKSSLLLRMMQATMNSAPLRLPRIAGA